MRTLESNKSQSHSLRGSSPQSDLNAATSLTVEKSNRGHLDHRDQHQNEGSQSTKLAQPAGSAQWDQSTQHLRRSLKEDVESAQVTSQTNNQDQSHDANDSAVSNSNSNSFVAEMFNSFDSFSDFHDYNEVSEPQHDQQGNRGNAIQDHPQQQEQEQKIDHQVEDSMPKPERPALPYDPYRTNTSNEANTNGIANPNDVGSVDSVGEADWSTRATILFAQGIVLTTLVSLFVVCMLRRHCKRLALKREQIVRMSAVAQLQEWATIRPHGANGAANGAHRPQDEAIRDQIVRMSSLAHLQEWATIRPHGNNEAADGVNGTHRIVDGNHLPQDDVVRSPMSAGNVDLNEVNQGLSTPVSLENNVNNNRLQMSPQSAPSMTAYSIPQPQTQPATTNNSSQAPRTITSTLTSILTSPFRLLDSAINDWSTEQSDVRYYRAIVERIEAEREAAREKPEEREERIRKAFEEGKMVYEIGEDCFHFGLNEGLPGGLVGGEMKDSKGNLDCGLDGLKAHKGSEQVEFPQHGSLHVGFAALENGGTQKLEDNIMVVDLGKMDNCEKPSAPMFIDDDEADRANQLEETVEDTGYGRITGTEKNNSEAEINVKSNYESKPIGIFTEVDAKVPTDSDGNADANVKGAEVNSSSEALVAKETESNAIESLTGDSGVSTALKENSPQFDGGESESMHVSDKAKAENESTEKEVAKGKPSDINDDCRNGALKSSVDIMGPNETLAAAKSESEASTSPIFIHDVSLQSSSSNDEAAAFAEFRRAYSKDDCVIFRTTSSASLGEQVPTMPTLRTVQSELAGTSTPAETQPRTRADSAAPSFAGTPSTDTDSTPGYLYLPTPHFNRPRTRSEPSYVNSSQSMESTHSATATNSQHPAANNRLAIPNQCAICLCDYEPGDTVVTSASCSHAFHQECIIEWLVKMQEGTPCPCCRSTFVELESHNSSNGNATSSGNMSLNSSARSRTSNSATSATTNATNTTALNSRSANTPSQSPEEIERLRQERRRRRIEEGIQRGGSAFNASRIRIW